MNTFKTLRLQSGLSIKDCARLLSIDPVSVRRFEMDPNTTKTGRNAPALTLKVLEWYIKQIPPSL